VTIRHLRKFEYQDNSKTYLDNLDKTILLMDKEIASKIKLWYLKMYQVSIQNGLGTIGYHYLLERMEKRDFPSQMPQSDRDTVALFLNARFYDNSLKIMKKNDLVLREMKDYSREELKRDFQALSDKVMLLLVKHLKIFIIKMGITLATLSRKNCITVIDRKTCLFFKEDMIRAVADRDFRVSYQKVNTLFTDIMRKI